MSAVTGVIAGIAAAAGAVAIYRFAERRTRSLRKAMESRRGRGAQADRRTLDFERDPATGVYRSK